MNVVSSATSRWTVSARAAGEVLTATAPGADVQLTLLGVPAGYSPAEIAAWLDDLAGVARETSRTDDRVRSIPPLLHHALTGLLYSHGDLWNGTQPMPCSLAFATVDGVASFGWVGEAQVRVRVNGQVLDPQWVRVRDDVGREAFAVAFGPGVHVEIDLRWGADANGAPLVALGADWSPPAPGATVVAVPAASPFVAPAPAVTPLPGEVESDLEPEWARAARRPANPAAPLPPELPVDQPSLQQPVHAMPAPPVWTPDDAPEVEPPVPMAPHVQETATTSVPSQAPEIAPAADAPAQAHPVQNWLTRMMKWGQSGEAPAAKTAEPAMPAPAPAGDAMAAPGRPPVWQPEDAADAPHAVRAEEGAQAPPMPAAPEPVRESPADPEPHAESAMPTLRTQLLAGTPLAFEITHEPVGAHETFGIPRVPPGQEEPPPPPRSEGPPPLPPTPAPASAASREPLVIESHSGAGAEPQRREIPAQLPVRPAGEPARFVPPVPPPSAHQPPIPHPTEPPAVRPLPPVASAPTPAPAAAPIDAQLAMPAAAPIEQPVPPVAAMPPLAETPGFEPSGSPAFVPAATPSAPTLEEAPFSVTAAPRAPRSLHLPELSDRPKVPWTPKRIAPWAGLLAALVLVGWWIGHMDDGQKGGTPRWLRAVGLGGARFDVNVTSDPPGAFINVDGKDLERRTPAVLDLPPGDHQVTLSLPDLGSAVFPVKGAKGDRVTLAAPLAGSLEILSADPRMPLNVAVNGKPMGYAPVRIDTIAPGLHEVTFSGPSMPAWVQSVQVGIHQQAQVLARPVSSPNTGVIQVQAQLSDEGGTSPLSGAQVYVDGALRGSTPVTLELPRGPHSLRLEWKGVSAPVQVIDLPGGNQRFATFSFGLDNPDVVLDVIGSPRFSSATETQVVSAEIAGLQPGDVREGWLHVRAAEGVWRRYPLTNLPGPLGVVLVGIFPPGAFDGDGRTRWYMSAITRQGDEFYSEIQSAAIGGAPKPKSKPAAETTEN